MQLKTITAALVASLFWQSAARAQMAGYGYGYAPTVPGCAYPNGQAGGASSVNDDVSKAYNDYMSKKDELRQAKKDVEKKLSDQDKARTAITDAIQDRWSDPILQHMENGWVCGHYEPVAVAHSTYVPNPPPAPAAEPPQAPLGGPPSETGVPPGAGCAGSECGHKHRHRHSSPSGSSPSSGGSTAVDQNSSSNTPAYFVPVASNDDFGGDRSPASEGAPTRMPAAFGGREPAQAAGDAAPIYASGVDGNGNPAAGGQAAAAMPSECPPPYQDACGQSVPGYGGGSGGGGKNPFPPNVPPFGLPGFLAICKDGGGINSRACSDPLYRNGDASRSQVAKCVSAIANYRKIVKDLDKLQNKVASLETEVDELKEKLGDAQKEAKEDARLEAECPECAAHGRGSRGGGGPAGPTLAQSIIGGAVALGSVGLGYLANQQNNKINEGLGYPTQSFAPYAGYYAGQGLAQAAFGTPFVGQGLYGGVASGVNGGFGCAATVGGGGFPYGPGGGVPYGLGINAGYGQTVPSPFYPGTGGLYQPGISPWGLNGPTSGFGSPYSQGGYQISLGGTGGLVPSPFAQGGYSGIGSPLVPYGGAGVGFNPLNFGAFPAVPGSGNYSPYLSGSLGVANPYASLGGSYYGGGYGGYGGSAGAYQDAYLRSLGNSYSSGAGYAGLAAQYQQLNTNVSQMNSGFGTQPLYNSGSIYGNSLYGSGYTVAPGLYNTGGYYNGLTVGNGGSFGVSPLGLGGVSTELPR